MIEHALQYAGRGFRVFPVHTTITGRCSCNRDCGKDAGKHPRIGAWQKHATTDPAQIEKWWGRWPQSNIGVCTGSGLVVVDIDGGQDLATLQALIALRGPLPATLMSATGRGRHAWYAGELAGSRTIDGLLVRGAGGYVLAPPSHHASGRKYEWINQLALAALPDWFYEWFQSSGRDSSSKPVESLLGPLPSYLTEPLQTVTIARATLTETAAQSLQKPWSADEEERIWSALQAIPADCPRDIWLRIGMALHGLHWGMGPDGADRGFELWLDWSETAKTKFQGEHDLATRWRSFGRPGRGGVTLGTLFHIAEQHGWNSLVPPAAGDSTLQQAGSPSSTLFTGAAQQPYLNGHASEPDLLGATVVDATKLIRLNERYACIGDLGGKCLVMGWVPSKVDAAIQVPSFQAFRSFTERYAASYIKVKKKKGEDEQTEQIQVGAAWLKWKHRRSFEGIDMAPNEPAVLQGNVLNLWTGFGVPAVAGRWDRMREHVAEVLAQGSAESALYILKWAAWAVQNPGERAETALVFRGEKGSGKGTFAHALRKLFGQHGLHIANSKHLVGAFNAHLRNCLLLFADEAFWAGDKQGESVLKALITEPVSMIEQKGVDATQWRNRLHVIMAANAEWVVPASHDERRYAMFNVSNHRVRDEKYFDAIHTEMMSGGLSAMLHDLLQVKLGDWHPRRILQTEALQQQKLKSLDPRYEWFEGLLQDGILPYSGVKEGSRAIPTQFLMHHIRENAPRMRDISTTALGLFLKMMGCVKTRTPHGNGWLFEPLAQARERWLGRFGVWSFDLILEEWSNKN